MQTFASKNLFHFFTGSGEKQAPPNSVSLHPSPGQGPHDFQDAAEFGSASTRAGADSAHSMACSNDGRATQEQRSENATANDVNTIKKQRKRRKISQETAPVFTLGEPTGPHPVVELPSPHVPSLDKEQSRGEAATPPKKMLRLRDNGTFTSPVTPRSNSTKRRNRPKSMIAVIKYSQGSQLGVEIDHILCGISRNTTNIPVKSTLISGNMSKSSKPHPFFTEKQVKHDSPKQVMSPARKQSAATPGKIRAQMASLRAERDTMISPLRPVVASGTKSKSTMSRPLWPSGADLHVRGPMCSVAWPRDILYARRKMKYATKGNQSSGVLANYRPRPDSQHSSHERPDGFRNPPANLRLPKQLFMTGSEIRQRIDRKTQAHLTHQALPHPVLRDMYAHLVSDTTPWDHGQSETRAWTDKYAPKACASVLQQGQEAAVLASWLKSLTTSAVETALRQTADTSDHHKKKKRRRKQDDLEGFVIPSDDEELGTLEPLPDVQSVMRGAHQHEPHTLVRTYPHAHPSQKGHNMIANAVVISGRHGCGKTAMVYAVAKELGYEVFEINSGVRRSGKDVLERVGDMTGNHQVQRRRASGGTEALPMADKPEVTDLVDSTAEDVASGRQGTMTSFFQKKGGPVTKPQPKVPKRSPKKTLPNTNVQQTMAKKTSRQQKQSLILLEDVDVLFDEDKGFWSTVLTMIVASKRPVVMTCTDESVVPLQAMVLHAVLRLTPPCRTLAADYMVLMAAREGHLLKRRALENLYKSKNHDLRASINEMQLWCQMGVGDPRGGLSWIYQRWPSGQGEDAQGFPIRVVSKGTFLDGMGTEPEIESQSHRDCIDIRTLQAWDIHSMDPRDALFESSERSHDPEVQAPRDRFKSRLAALQQACSQSYCLSDLDLIGGIGRPDGRSKYSSDEQALQAKLDPTQPALGEKARLSYTEEHPLLQADEMTDFAQHDRSIAVRMCSLLRAAHNDTDDTCVDDQGPDVSSYLRRRPIRNHVSRADFSVALDPLAQETAPTATSGLVFSTIDSPLTIVATEIAPYIRSIIRYDIALEEQRHRMSSILTGSQQSVSDTGVAAGSLSSSQGKQKMRTTRAARSALEGGQRQLTRRERWFAKQDDQLDFEAVLRTGGREWATSESHVLRSIAGSAGPDAMD